MPATDVRYPHHAASNAVAGMARSYTLCGRCARFPALRGQRSSSLRPPITGSCSDGCNPATSCTSRQANTRAACRCIGLREQRNGPSS